MPRTEQDRQHWTSLSNIGRARSSWNCRGRIRAATMQPKRRMGPEQKATDRYGKDGRHLIFPLGWGPWRCVRILGATEMDARNRENQPKNKSTRYGGNALREKLMNAFRAASTARSTSAAVHSVIWPA